MSVPRDDLLPISPVRRHALEAALLAVAAVWGATFPAVKEAVEDVPPLEFLALRFLAAAILVTAIAPREVAALGRAGWFAGGLAGVALFGGFTFQTIGLQYTTASNAGFVTGLYVVFTPLLAAVVLRRRPSAGVAVGALVAVGGLALLSFSGRAFALRYGDGLVLACAVAFAAQFVVLGRYAPGLPAGGLAAAQLWVCGILASGLSLAIEEPVAPRTAAVWMALAITAVLASAVAFVVQALAQRSISPSRTALILVMETPFAALFGFLLLGERFAGWQWAGAALILAGMLAAELAPARAREA